jgi:myo-inositol 2-dehydrogenase/D-chiro-inositol 1-dehydrogenase
MVGVGIIGAGVMGADHARLLAAEVQDARLVAVTDPDTVRAEAIAARVPDCRVLADGQALIHDPRVDAILIASPDQTHHDLVLACLAAGKPVLCEKPLAMTAAQCLAICEAEMKLGRKLVQVGFMRRFDPSYAAMKAALRGGAYGKSVALHCVHRNASAPAWFDARMLITNSAVHEFDIARWLLDREFVAVSAFPQQPADAAVAKSRRLIVLETGDDIVVDIEVFVNAGYGYDVRGELVCETGTIALIPKAQAQIRAQGQERLDFAPDWRGHFAEAYRIELQAWVKAIGEGRTTGASAWDGYMATAIAEAGVAAGEKGSRVNIIAQPRPAFYG